jgi:hypothetical protein
MDGTLTVEVVPRSSARVKRPGRAPFTAFAITAASTEKSGLIAGRTRRPSGVTFTFTLLLSSFK